MANNKSKLTATAKSSPSGSSRKRLRRTATNSGNQNLPVKAKKTKRHRWIPLNNLIELDWNKYIRWTVAKQTLLKGKVHIIDHDYEIRPVNLFPDEHSALELNAGDRFLIIPIKEPEAALSQRRSVLVREEQTFDKGRLILVDAEPPKDLSADDKAFYRRIYVLGEDSAVPEEREPHIIGAVEAVLTVNDPVTPWTVSHSIPSTRIIPTSPDLPPVQVTPAPLDEALLERLDELNRLKECYDPTGRDVVVLQEKINEYLGDQYNLKVIPIEVNRTHFDEKLGHIMAKSSHLTYVEDGIITAVFRIGYIRNSEVVRKANVVVNRHATHIVRLTDLALKAFDSLQVEMSTPEGYTIGELIREAAMQIDALDALYDWIHIFATGSPVQIKDLARRLLQANRTHEIPRGILKEVNSQHLQVTSLTHDSRMLLTLYGEAKSLKKLSDILYAEARNRTNNRYYPAPEDGWIFKELCGLQPFLPKGIDVAKFTKDGDRNLREILERISFARDLRIPSTPKPAPKNDSE